MARILAEEVNRPREVRAYGLTPGIGGAQPADEEIIAWIPASLQEKIRERLANIGRIAQEALGWERLCVLRDADPLADFSLGFSPRI